MYSERIVELLQARGALSSQEIADVICPGMNAGRIGEVLNILRKSGRVSKCEKLWEIVP